MLTILTFYGVILVLCLIGFWFMFIRSHMPIISVYNRDSGGAVTREQGMYVITVAEKVPIPSFQWRELHTKVLFCQSGVITLFGKKFFPFGRIGLRVMPTYEWKMKGLDIMPYVFPIDTPKEITLIGTNYNSKNPLVVRPGDKIAYIDFVYLSGRPIAYFSEKEVTHGNTEDSSTNSSGRSK